jgi:xanthine dehydrogenase molybdopterin-binding subunit B
MFVEASFISAYMNVPKIPDRPRASSFARVEMKSLREAMESTSDNSPAMGEQPFALTAAASIKDL